MKYVYKIIAFLLAVAILPLFFFTPLVSIRIQSTALQILAFIGQVKGNDQIEELVDENGQLPSHIGESISLYDVAFGDINSLAGSISSIASNFDKGVNTEQLEKLVAPVFAFLSEGVLAVLCAIITAMVAIFAKDNRKVIYSALAGFGFSYMMPATFKAIAAPFLSQEISLSSLMDSMLAGLLGKVVNFQISSSFWVIPAVFIVIIIWTVLYNYTLPEDQKRERKLMLGEADE